MGTCSGRARRRRVEACLGISLHLKAGERRGFLSPFPSPARCPSFNTGLISFLLPAQRCRWVPRNGPSWGGGERPAPRIANGNTLPAREGAQSCPAGRWAPQRGLGSVGRGRHVGSTGVSVNAGDRTPAERWLLPSSHFPPRFLRICCARGSRSVREPRGPREAGGQAVCATLGLIFHQCDGDMPQGGKCPRSRRGSPGRGIRSPTPAATELPPGTARRGRWGRLGSL